jgi:isocitrate lyase
MPAYCRLQEDEFRNEERNGYQGVNHQRFVGTGYFDAVQQILTAVGPPPPAAETPAEGDKTVQK